MENKDTRGVTQENSCSDSEKRPKDPFLKATQTVAEISTGGRQ